MVTLIVKKQNTNTQGGFDIRVITTALDPNWGVPTTLEIDNHNYEVRQKGVENSVVTYVLSDSGVSQN